MLVNMCEFEPPSNCAVLTSVVFVWSELQLCPLRSKLLLQRKYSVSSIDFFGTLWWTVMRTEFIVSDGKLWSRSGWMFSIPYSVIVFLFVSSNNYSSSEYSMFCYTCVSRRWLLSWVHFCSMSRNCIPMMSCIGCINIFDEVFGSWSILMIVLKKLLYGCLFIY